MPHDGSAIVSDILLLGARGFIGRHVARMLELDGHRVVPAGRPEMDLARDTAMEAWVPRVADFDVVINAAGIFREAGRQTFREVHVSGPTALFGACARTGTKVVHFSALGADANAVTEFHRARRAADEALLALDVPSMVLQPSLVFGPDGASARLFMASASLPVIFLPGDGRQRIQPIHVDDVAAAVAAIVREDAFTRERVALVGPRPTEMRAYLAALRGALGLGKPRFIEVPRGMVAWASRLRLGLLDQDALSMLERGNVADPAGAMRLLGRPPRQPGHFVPPETRESLRTWARLAWLAPVLRVAIAAVWLTAGVVSAGIYPVDESLELLARVGLHGTLASLALYGAAALDFAIGLATLFMKRRRWLWAAQGVLILAYTAIITVALPEQWLHPFGAVVKNLPMLAGILLLHQLERDR